MLRRRVSTAVVCNIPRWQSSGNSAEQRNAKQEELDREARLRQQIFQKQQEGSSQSIFGRFMPTPPPPGAGWPGSNGQRPSFGSMLWSTLIYTTAFYCIIMTWQMRKSEQSYFMSMQGMPKFVTPPEVTACFLAVRTLLSVSKQRELQTEYERYKQIHPNANFYHFLINEKPTALAGRLVSQPQFIAAMVAAYSGTGNMKWTKAITQVSRWSDDEARVDAAMDNLRRDFPNLIGQSSLGSPVPAAFAQPQSQYPTFNYASAPQWAAQQALWAPSSQPQYSYNPATSSQDGQRPKQELSEDVKTNKDSSSGDIRAAPSAVSNENHSSDNNSKKDA